MSKLLVICLIVALNSHVFADQVLMINGDRLTGKLIRQDAEIVILETEVAGEVKLRRALIEKIIPAVVTEKPAESVKTEPNPEAKTVTVPAEPKAAAKAPVALRPSTDPAESSFLRYWSGSVDAGFSLTSGNSRTRTFTGGLRGVRETEKNKLTIYANGLQVRNTTSGRNVTTAQSVWSGIRYDINLGQKWFAYSAGDFEYNKPQRLDLRAVFGAGAGYKWIRNDRTNFSVTMGTTHNYENFSNGLVRNSGEASFGEELRHSFNSRVRLNQRFVFYPNLSRPGQFRALFDGSIQTDFNSWLGMHLTIGNRYNSQPILQTKKNDFLLSTGLRVSFGKNRKK